MSKITDKIECSRYEEYRGYTERQEEIITEVKELEKTNVVENRAHYRQGQQDAFQKCAEIVDEFGAKYRTINELRCAIYAAIADADKESDDE